MTNRLAVALACVAAVSLGGNAFAQKSRQSLPSDNTIAVTEDTTVKLNGESELYKETEASSPLDRKVSIRVSNVPISAFLNSITTQAKINFIMSEEFANKKVTASLTRVTVREALDTLLRQMCIRDRPQIPLLRFIPLVIFPCKALVPRRANSTALCRRMCLLAVLPVRPVILLV